MVGKTRTVLVVRYWYLSRLIELLWAAGLLFYTGAQVLVLSGVREDKYSPYAGVCCGDGSFLNHRGEVSPTFNIVKIRTSFLLLVGNTMLDVDRNNFADIRSYTHDTQPPCPLTVRM